MVKQHKKLDRWQILIVSSLKSEDTSERIISLEFLQKQDTIEVSLAKIFMPLILENVLHPDTKVRYFARKARNHFYDTYSEIESPQNAKVPFKLEIKDGETLTAKQILLHKLQLGSRYVVFEAIDRLTESGDTTLINPLIKYLETETDEYKISYLVKRICRLKDQRVVKAVERFLDHEDQRIVANTLEGLCFQEIPDLADKLIDFATSSDNRIRANAILGLHRYERVIAEKHIEEMMRSDNIALQDSAVFLLMKLRPSNLGAMLEIAQHSRFATIRLKTLDIMPPTLDELDSYKIEPEDMTTEIDRCAHDFIMMSLMLGASIVMLYVASMNSRELVLGLFLVVGFLTILMPDKTRLCMQKSVLSIGFICTLGWGNTKLMVLPVIIGIWLSWTHYSTKVIGDDEEEVDKLKSEPVYVWFFVVGAILISQALQGDLASSLTLASSFISEIQNVPADIRDIVMRQNNFEIMLFTFISVISILLLRLNQWFPSKKNKPKPLKRLLVGVVVGLFIITILNLSHVGGIKLELKMQGKTITDIVESIIRLK